MHQLDHTPSKARAVDISELQDKSFTSFEQATANDQSLFKSDPDKSLILRPPYKGEFHHLGNGPERDPLHVISIKYEEGSSYQIPIYTLEELIQTLVLIGS